MDRMNEIPNGVEHVVVMGCDGTCTHKYKVKVSVKLTALSRLLGKDIVMSDEYHFSDIALARTFMEMWSMEVHQCCTHTVEMREI